MNQPYGPWATLMTAGTSPQLSAFWRRRLGLLVSVSRANAALSRRNVLLLAVTAILVCLLPTFRAAPAVAQQQQAAKIASGPKNIETGTKETAVGEIPYAFTAVDNNGRAFYATLLLPEPRFGYANCAHFAFPFYAPSLNDDTRLELHLSRQQEESLGELNRKYLAEFRPSERKGRDLDKATATATPAEKKRKLDELRRQVETLLTAEQLATLKALVFAECFSPGLLLDNGKAPPTEEQMKEYHRLALLQTKLVREVNKAGDLLDRQYDERAILLLTPAERGQLDRDLGEAEFGKPILFGQQLYLCWASPPGIGYVDYPPRWEYPESVTIAAENGRVSLGRSFYAN